MSLKVCQKSPLSGSTGKSPMALVDMSGASSADATDKGEGGVVAPATVAPKSEIGPTQIEVMRLNPVSTVKNLRKPSRREKNLATRRRSP
jgi:hypothetical protein